MMATRFFSSPGVYAWVAAQSFGARAPSRGFQGADGKNACVGPESKSPLKGLLEPRGVTNAPGVNAWAREKAGRRCGASEPSPRITTLPRRHILLVLMVVLAIAPAAQAQQQITPRIGYVYPAGGRQGASLEVTVGGQFLDGVAQAFVSGAGIQATVAEYVKPVTPQQFNKLKDRLQELQTMQKNWLKQSSMQMSVNSFSFAEISAEMSYRDC